MSGAAMIKARLILCDHVSNPLFVRIASPKRFFFGISREQFALHKADRMIKAGFRGKGIAIAVIDAGFTNVDVIPISQNTTCLDIRILSRTDLFFRQTITAPKCYLLWPWNQPYLMIGSAPKRLTGCSDPRFAKRISRRRGFWVEAIEFADSVGVDIVNTSLGYSDFDDPLLSYRYEQMNGSTSLMTLCCRQSFRKRYIIWCAVPEMRAINPGERLQFLPMLFMRLRSELFYVIALLPNLVLLALRPTDASDPI
jgi:hypothetical protein